MDNAKAKAEALFRCGYLERAPELSAGALEAFARLTGILRDAGDKLNVTAIRGEVEIYLKHYIDSLSLLTAAPFRQIGQTEVVDIGSGGGFPGLPLKIAVPALRITMIDSTEKKISHIRETAQKLELQGLSLIAARAEELTRPGGAHRERYGVAVARAVARLNILAELCLPFVKKDGCFVAMKGARAIEELKEAEFGIERLGGEVETVIDLPFDFSGLDLSLFSESERAAIREFQSVKRYLIVIRKRRLTPESFPRAYAAMMKRPLEKGRARNG